MCVVNICFKCISKILPVFPIVCVVEETSSVNARRKQMLCFLVEERSDENKRRECGSECVLELASGIAEAPANALGTFCRSLDTGLGINLEKVLSRRHVWWLDSIRHWCPECAANDDPGSWWPESVCKQAKELVVDAGVLCNTSRG